MYKRQQDEHTLHVVRQSGKDCRIIKSGRRKPPVKSENMKTNEVNKEISYETLLVTFGEGIGRLNTMFDDPQVWGVATLKQMCIRDRSGSSPA